MGRIGYQVNRESGCGYEENRGSGNCHPQTKFEAATHRNIC